MPGPNPEEVPVPQPQDAIPPVAPNPAEERQLAELEALEGKLLNIQQRVRTGANWFYWVAGLSVVNTILMHAGGGLYFVVGLGVTLIADAVGAEIANDAPDKANLAHIIVFGFDFFVTMVVLAFGWCANKRYQAAFIVGMILYALDGILFLVMSDWLSVGFHVYALIHMGSGFLACRELKRLEAEHQPGRMEGEAGGLPVS